MVYMRAAVERYISRQHASAQRRAAYARAASHREALRCALFALLMPLIIADERYRHVAGSRIDDADAFSFCLMPPLPAAHFQLRLRVERCLPR